MPLLTSMRQLTVFLVFCAACLALPAMASAPLSYDDARHLLNRTGFGATDAEIRRFTGMSREDAARKLLATTRTVAAMPPPAWTAQSGPLRYPRAGADASEMERKQFQQEQIREGLQLRGWWVNEMLTTPSPLTERMTLFWHNHFVSSQQKVRLAELMYRQNVTLRANALGHFGDLLHAVARDPAMVIYLDNARNRKGTPNENFAREVMELFTLGEGNYSEQDIKEAARAFTGWSLDRDSGNFVFRPLIHDYGTKSVLGRTGNLDGDDVLDALLAQRATAEFITRKLWREFVSPDPDEAQVKRIANRFRDTRYDIKVALYELLTSDAFYAKEHRGVLIKSPIDLVVGTLKQFDMRPSEPVPFAVAARPWARTCFRRRTSRVGPAARCGSTAAPCSRASSSSTACSAPTTPQAGQRWRRKQWRPCPVRLSLPARCRKPTPSVRSGLCGQWIGAFAACNSKARRGSPTSMPPTPRAWMPPRDCCLPIRRNRRPIRRASLWRWCVTSSWTRPTS